MNGAARLLGIHPVTSHGWATGEKRVPQTLNLVRLLGD
jgi:hypothetical protein